MDKLKTYSSEIAELYSATKKLWKDGKISKFSEPVSSTMLQQHLDSAGELLGLLEFSKTEALAAAVEQRLQNTISTFKVMVEEASTTPAGKFRSVEK